MLLGATFFFAAIFLPIALGILLFPQLRRGASKYLPVGGALNLGCFGVLSCLVTRWFSFGIPLVVALSFTSATITLIVLSLLKRRIEYSPSRLPLTLLLATLAVADIGFIMARQGWSFDPQSFVNETYFRAPLNSDSQRNVILVNAIIRKEGSPFVIGSPLAYQVFWHTLVSPLAALYDGITRYQIINGLALGTAWLFFFTLFSFLPAVWAYGFLLFAFHADIFHLVLSLLSQHRLGIEADWSAIPAFFRNSSFKLSGLVAPQHTMFLLFSLPVLFLRDLTIQGIFLVFAFLTSPVLWLMLFPIYFIAQLAFRRFHVLRLWPVIPVAYGTYWCLIGSPLALFSRPGMTTAFGVTTSEWLSFPFSLVAATGFLGVIASYLTVSLIRKREFSPVLLALVTTNLVFQFIITGSEIRRHVALVLALLSTVLVVQTIARPRFLGSAFAVMGMVHLYFIYCFVGKPSSVDPALAWQDYFHMNRNLKGPVLSANEPVFRHIIFSPVNEATTTYGHGGHVPVHSRLSSDQLELLKRVVEPHDILFYAERLGYQQTVWGPLEDRIWGPQIKARYIHPQNEIARNGSVGLYWLKDKLAPELAQFNLSKPTDYLPMGDYFFSRGWLREAIDSYEVAYHNGTDKSVVSPRLASALTQYGAVRSAEKFQ